MDGNTQLTGREKEVLLLMANGNMNTKIANDLGIAEATVQHHIDNAKNKLRAQTRAHAVLLAVREGIFEGALDSGEA